MIRFYFSNGVFVGAKSKRRNQLYRNPSGGFLCTWGYILLFFFIFLFFIIAATANGCLRRNRLTFLDLLVSHITGQRHGPQTDPGRPILPIGLIGAKKKSTFILRGKAPSCRSRIITRPGPMGQSVPSYFPNIGFGLTTEVPVSPVGVKKPGLFSLNCVIG